MPEAQVKRKWSAPGGTLGELTAQSAVRARESSLGRGELEAIVASLGSAPRFSQALRGPNVAVVGELKRSSPSKGVLDASLDARSRARAYVAGGAVALSILTEPTRFGGSLSDLRDVASAVDVPLLRKDFITDPVQLLEARAYGASAVLLIARALAPDVLATLAARAQEIGLEALVEVRDERELAEAIALPGAIIGVNNRNLETLEIDAKVSGRLIPTVPADRLVIYESGVRGAADVSAAGALGADAVLVGSVLTTAKDGAEAVRALTGIARQRRG